MQLINIGYGNIIVAERIVVIMTPGTAPLKRLKEEAKQKGKLIDVTYGKKTRSVIVTDTDHLILSPVNSQTISMRIEGNENDQKEENEN